MDKRILKNLETRLGQTKKNCKGDLMKIIQYNATDNIIVEFQDEFHYTTKTSYRNFLKGEVTNLFGRHICGIGYLGNSSSYSNGRTKKSYYIWNQMIKRCYSEKKSTKTPYLYKL